MRGQDMTAGAFSNLTLAVTPAGSVSGSSTVIAGFLADENNRGRLYRPDLTGLAPVSGDAANVWLPTITSITAITASDGTNTETGQYKVVIKPGTKDTVNVASVQTVYVDANTLFITVTGTW